jgi:zinc protease
VTSPPSARLALAVALAAAAPLGAGCRTGQGREGPDYLGGGKAASPPVTGEATLGNGVKVVVEENHVTPLVAIQVWVAAGAADDPAELAGAAHLYEHLVLRGGKKWGPGGGVREIDAVRGSVGAWTGLDETVYQVLVAAPFFELGLDVLADAIANPNFDPAEVERARKVALDEIAAAEADPGRRATQAVFAAAFAGHGYARPVTGTAASVAGLPRDALAGRFADTHAGRALTVVVVGDVGKNAVGAVERAFAAVPGGARGKAPARGAIAAASGPQVAVSSAGFQSPEIVIGFPAGKVSVEHAAMLDLAAAVLAGGAGSRMQRELVRNRRLAAAVRPVSFRSRDGGLWAFVVTPAPQRIAEAAEAALALLLEFQPGAVGAEELAGARAVLEADLARAGDGPLARARRLGFERVIAQNERDRQRYLEVVRTSKPGELRDAVAEVLSGRALTLAVALPQAPPAGRDEAPALKQRLEAALKSAPARAAQRAAPAVGDGDAARLVTPGGVRVLALRDATAPLVSVEAAWVDRVEAGGAPDEVAALIAALLDRGTRTRSAADVAAEMQALGGSLRGFAGAGALGLRADFLPPHLERGLGLVADVLRYPAFPEEAVEAESRAIAYRRRAEAKASESGPPAAVRLFQEALAPDARRADGESVSTLTKLGLLDRYRRRYPPSRLVVAVVGDVSPARVAEVAAAAFADRAPAARPAAAAPASAASGSTARPEVQAERPTTVFRAVAGVDSTAVVGYPALPAIDLAPGPSRRAADVLADVLAGEAGRLTGALRDERTAGCQAGTRVAAGAPGYLAVSVTCAPARIDAAVAAVRTELGRVAAQGPTAEEVTRATRRLTGARAAQLRSGMAIADAMVNDEAQGLPMFAYRQNLAALAGVTVADVSRVARAVFDPQREVIAVVHPPSAAPGLARTSAGVNRSGRAEAER